MERMDHRRAHYHHGDLRNSLVSAAVRLIEQGGHEGFSLREAAREVGVSANAAYRHFADKSALVAAVTSDGFEQLSRHMQKVIASVVNRGNPRSAAVARFKAVGRAYVEFASEHPQLFRLMFGAEGAARPDAASVEAPAHATPSPYQLLGQALDDLVAEGLLPADRRWGAEMKAWTVVHGFALLWLHEGAALPGGLALAEALESILQFTVVGLCGELRSDGSA